MSWKRGFLLLEQCSPGKYHTSMGTSVRRIPALKDISVQRMKLLQPLFEAFRCSAGTIIIQQGNPADYLYLILKGKAVISYKPYDGHAMTVSHVEKGGLFGWS